MNSRCTTANSDSTHTQKPFNVYLSDRLSVRLYPDCCPSCLETGAIQKGLVLLLDGKELIEEGVGFGVPVVKYIDKTFFSSKALVFLQDNRLECTLRKVFTLDTVSVKKVGKASYINDKIYSLIRKTFQILYLKHGNLKPLFNKFMEMRELLHIRTEFQIVKPRGTIPVTYQCIPGMIKIQVDLSDLTLEGCREILLLNEQGSSTFQKYADTRGNTLVGNRIGAWDRVTADYASLQSLNGQLEFSLKRVDGTMLFRGWERTRKRFSWAGLSYSMAPKRGAFTYSVALNFQEGSP